VNSRRASRPSHDEVLVPLSYDEALVLSDLLARWYEQGYQALDLKDPAEKRVLDDLCATFEPVIDEVFSANYAEVVTAARQRIRAAWER
jgi:hypothetical protein